MSATAATYAFLTAVAIALLALAVWSFETQQHWSVTAGAVSTLFLWTLFLLGSW